MGEIVTALVTVSETEARTRAVTASVKSGSTWGRNGGKIFKYEEKNKKFKNLIQWRWMEMLNNLKEKWKFWTIRQIINGTRFG